MVKVNIGEDRGPFEWMSRGLRQYRVDGVNIAFHDVELFASVEYRAVGVCSGFRGDMAV
jgi:hypothetical protein